MRLALTHLLHAGERRPPDALAVSLEPAGLRHFVPGWLPCGECGQCRRGWMSACLRGRALGDDRELEVGDRFLTAVDEPAGVAALEDGRAACAGVVAELQELAARTGLGSGDIAVWIGDGAFTTLGARLSAARGCATFLLRSRPGLGPALDQGQDQGPGSRIRSLRHGDGPKVWNESVGAVAAAAPGAFLERRLFVESAEPALVEAAIALAVPGTSIGFIQGTGGGALPPSALASCRVIVSAGRGYHPDLIPEALAALRRDPTLTDDLLGEGGFSLTRL
jgi:threonine dehydrogenase-like Zn-dependent dehydrogenase